jgi:hypothetical protein
VAADNDEVHRMEVAATRLLRQCLVEDGSVVGELRVATK